MHDKAKLFTLLEAAEYVLIGNRGFSSDTIGEENADVCWRFARAFGEAMTRFLVTRVPHEVCIVHGSFWVVARYKGAPWSTKSICIIGTSIVTSYENTIAIKWTGTN